MRGYKNLRWRVRAYKNLRFLLAPIKNILFLPTAAHFYSLFFFIKKKERRGRKLAVAIAAFVNKSRYSTSPKQVDTPIIDITLFNQSLPPPALCAKSKALRAPIGGPRA